MIMNKSKSSELPNDEVFETFCYMIIEEFMMKKKLSKTLETFRSEYTMKDDNASILNWYDISLRLHLSDMPSNCNPSDPVLENLVKFLITESSVRTRKSQEVIVKGLATLPKMYKSMPNMEQSKELMLKTLNPSATTTDMPMHYPGLNHHNLNPRKTELTPDLVFKPPPRYDVDKLMMKPQQLKNDGDKSGKLKASSENWIPELTRMRSFHRHIAVAKETVQDMIMREINTAREMKQFKKSDYEKTLELESLGTKKKSPCGCCFQMFSFINLPLKVSNKAVVDMRKKWSGGATTGWWIKIDQKLSHLSRCYDDVSVCTFCSQFFHDQDSYRPSFDTVYYEERKRNYLEQKRLDLEYWDPLKMSEKDRIQNEMRIATKTEEQGSIFESSEADLDSVQSSKP